MTSLSIQAVLFDLDGTLADTAPDLVAAVNVILAEQQRPTTPFAQQRPWVSHGAKAMLRAALPEYEESALDPLVERMIAYYRKHIAVHSRLFAGMDNVLTALEAHSVPWGIVTNKQSNLTEPLLHALALNTRCGCVVSGDTLAEKKPHPLPILHACQQLGVAPKHCLYVGDAQRDIEAGLRAGTYTAIAMFGYLALDDNPQAWGANWQLAQAEDILPLVFS